ncbi:MAG: hypothetical protein RL196_747 [Actinomycetota bacterium]|jgi:dihydropteroate synthase
MAIDNVSQANPTNGNLADSSLPRLMGVLNTTPDSFSDGGKFTSLEAALAQAKLLISQGATIIDVGGESTRPGATRLTAAEEQSRVIEVIQALAQLPEVASGGVAISIDTMNASTAVLAAEAGASIINDVSGSKADPKMFAAVANLAAGGIPVKYVLGHWGNFDEGAGAVQETENIVASVVGELAERAQLAETAGVKRAQLILDPGLGFGKSSEQNWQLVAGVSQLAKLDLPILIGASRKRFLAASVAEAAGIDAADVTLAQRDAATAELSVRLWNESQLGGFADKLWGFRVHNVQANFDVLQAAAALRFAH